MDDLHVSRKLSSNGFATVGTDEQKAHWVANMSASVVKLRVFEEKKKRPYPNQ